MKNTIENKLEAILVGYAERTGQLLQSFVSHNIGTEEFELGMEANMQSSKRSILLLFEGGNE